MVVDDNLYINTHIYFFTFFFFNLLNSFTTAQREYPRRLEGETQSLMAWDWELAQYLELTNRIKLSNETQIKHLTQYQALLLVSRILIFERLMQYIESSEASSVLLQIFLS